MIVLVLLMSFSSCINLDQNVLDGNLIKNGEFDEWDEFWKPSNWKVYNENKNIYVRPYEELSVQNCVSIYKNNVGEQYIYQNIKVKRNTFYFLSAEMVVNLNNICGGIYVFSAEEDKLLGKNESVFKNETKSIKLLFNSDKADVVSIKVGFVEREGLKGNINVCSITLTESDYQHNNLFESKEANDLVELLKLNFTNKKEFNRSVEVLAKFVNTVLLAGRRKDTVGMKGLKKLQRVFKSSSLLDEIFFNSSNEDIIIAYEQKVTYLLREVLMLFNIDSYVVDFWKEDKRTHTFLEYYNPFEEEKYNFIDPFFNIILQTKERNLEDLVKYSTIKEMGGIYSSIQLFSKRVKGSKMTNNKNYNLTYPF
tara:strand:+ start:20366 stop:21463 length:1098 start_codon:yes stop_codon:yes gene_type:complete